jgi:hypothetical protein
MFRKTFLTKTNSIISGSNYNTGLNPVATIKYGSGVCRSLIYFPIDKLKNLVENKTYPDITKLKHVLKLTNCGSIDNVKFGNAMRKEENSIENKYRATSFDIILFLIPQEWDAGRGFDYGEDFWINNRKSTSTSGCNWFQPKNGYEWDEEGIYSTQTLGVEYNKFANGEASIVIARQHFDFGNENFEIDITNTVNKFITGEIANHGIGLAFSPLLESLTTEEQQYVGFFTNHTNTFFEPYLESIYNEVIEDDRAKFFLNKTNKLYLFSNIGGEPTNLDILPTCEVNGQLYNVKQATRGVYYIEILLTEDDAQPEVMLYDTWSNLVYKGVNLKDVEQEFVVLGQYPYFSIGGDIKFKQPLVPTLSGIKSDEKIGQGEKRLVRVDFRVPYTTDERQVINGAYYRLYIRDGVREVGVIPYQPIHRNVLNNFFTIDMSELVPNQYWIDVKVESGQEIRHYKDLLRFKVVSDVTEIYN